MSKEQVHANSSAFVAEKIQSGNPWYLGSHFEWADQPSMRHIYARRYEYLTACIARTKQRLGPRLRLLDAGCGDGYWLSRLSSIEGLDLTGIDYNQTRVERAKQAVPAAQIYCSDLLSFDAKEPFDIILLNQVIEHVPDDVALLKRSHSLLREQGTFILGTPNEGSWLQQRQLRKLGAAADTDHVHFYTEPDIRGKLDEAGFAVDSIMREVFYIGNDRIYYLLNRYRWGFRFLELMTRLWPAGCSDFYFECRPK